MKFRQNMRFLTERKNVSIQDYVKVFDRTCKVTSGTNYKFYMTDKNDLYLLSGAIILVIKNGNNDENIEFLKNNDFEEGSKSALNRCRELLKDSGREFKSKDKLFKNIKNLIITTKDFFRNYFTIYYDKTCPLNIELETNAINLYYISIAKSLFDKNVILVIYDYKKSILGAKLENENCIFAFAAYENICYGTGWEYDDIRDFEKYERFYEAAVSCGIDYLESPEEIKSEKETIKESFMDEYVPATVTTVNDNLSVEEYFGTLMQSVVETWGLHLNTNKYSEHIALNELYDNLLESVDTLIENYKGIYGNIPAKPNVFKPEATSAAEYLIEFREFVENGRSLFTDSEILSDIDSILSAIDETLYKVENLTENRKRNRKMMKEDKKEFNGEDFVNYVANYIFDDLIDREKETNISAWDEKNIDYIDNEINNALIIRFNDDEIKQKMIDTFANPKAITADQKYLSARRNAYFKIFDKLGKMTTDYQKESLTSINESNKRNKRIVK